ncbi:hypothetical protein ABK040_005805 [Willaertia magna]
MCPAVALTNEDERNEDKTIIPIISYNDKDRINKIYKALTSIGFFYLIDHPIKDKLSKAFSYSKLFFNLPNEIKEELHTEFGESGYVSKQSERLNKKDIDFKEAYNICQLFHNKLIDKYFPNEEKFNELKGFKLFFIDLFNSYHNLLIEIVNDIELTLNIKLSMADNHSDKEHSLRLLHYPPIGEERENVNGAGIHTDYGSITLLSQDDTGGLQVLDRQTMEMIDAPCVKDAIIVNCGDLMQEWTDGKLKSVPHQVILNNKSKDRYSIAYFGQPNKNTIIPSLNISAYDYLLSKFASTYRVEVQK